VKQQLPPWFLQEFSGKAEGLMIPGILAKAVKIKCESAIPCSTGFGFFRNVTDYAWGG
jgi:hypothetical protein